ncbi:hypothetical protein LCGC14_1258240, partial [marine sediment metagenome]
RIAMDNILATQKTVSIPDSQTGLYKASSILNIIQVIPEGGKVFVDSNPRRHPEEVRINGEYWYYSSSQNGIFDTIFVVDEDKEVLAIGFDYDYNSFLEPNKKIFSEKHIISTGVAKGIDFSNLKPSNGVFLRDYKQYDGNFLDHTFTDSLYDIWKMSYTFTTSKLMKEVSSITSSQFIKSVKGRIVEDILWQVGSQLMALVTSIATATGTIGYLLTYGLLSARRTNLQSKVRKQLIAAQTFYNEDFEGEITLSTRKAYDKLWGGTLPNIVGGSTAGVYAHVQLETDKHLFKGDLLLAPSGVRKTGPLGLENKPISLDYTTQKGSYVIYSDFNDSRLAPYLKLSSFDFNTDVSYEDQIEAYYASLDKDLLYMQNSMMYLENTISKQSDGEYDTIYPYMMYFDGVFLPTFQFTGIDAKYPIPEFFHDYPVIVDKDSYEKLKDEYSTIYKVIDSDSSQDIELIPKDTRHRIYGEIDHIDVYFINSLGEKHQLSSYTEDEGHYSYNKTTGILTLSDGSYYALQYVLDLHKRNNQDIEGSDAYYILEIKVEKYRSATNLNGTTQEAVNHIATMQAIEQNILEYTFQYKHAQNTQQGLSEMFYTIFITTISTLITVGITAGIGALTSPSTGFVWDGTGWTLTDSLINNVAIKTFMSTLAQKIGHTSALAILTSPVKESLQEVFLDPYIETIVSDIVADLGWGVAWEVLISSLVEGGRESISGPLSQFLFGNTQTDTQGLIDTQHLYEEVNPTDQNAVEYNIETREYSLTYSPKLSSFFKTGASLILGAAILSIGGPMFFGATISSGLVALQSISKDFKIQKTIIHNIVNKQNLPAGYYQTADISSFGQSSTKIPNGIIENTIKLRPGLDPFGMPINQYSWNQIYFKTPEGDINRILDNSNDLQSRQESKKDENKKKLKTETQTSMLQFTGSKGLNLKRIKRVTVPGVSERLIQQVSKTKDWIDSVWTAGSAFGIIYLWTNTLNGKIMWGRTEQTLNQYAGVVPISDRMYTYIEKAEKYTKRDGSIYNDMHDIYVSAGGGVEGRKAILDTFTVEVFEIIPANNFDYDSKYIKALEDWWIDLTDSRNPAIGYNVRKGNVGGHKGHAKKDVDPGSLKMLIKSGFSQKQIADYFDVDRKTVFNRIKENWPETKGNWYDARRLLLKPSLIKYVKQGYSQQEIRGFFPSPITEDGLISRSQLYNIFKDCFEGKTFDDLQRQYLGNIIDSLIEQGFTTPALIASNIKAMNTKRVWTFLVNNKLDYATSLISSYISKGFVTTVQLAEQLSIKQWNVERIIEKNMRGIRTERLELFDKPRARRLITGVNTAEDLLLALDYSKNTIQTYKSENKIENVISKLFDGMSFDEAKLYYTSNYLGNR